MSSILKVNEPMFNTYHFLANHCVIAQQNPTGYKWFLNHCLNLYCSTRYKTGFSNFQATVFKQGILSNPNLDTYIMSTRFMNTGLRNLICKILDEGYYVAFKDIDDYYIEGKSFFHERHFYHDGLIFGYDDKDQTFWLSAYDNRMNYSQFKTPMKCFLDSIKNAKKNGVYPRLDASKAKNESVSIDYVLIENQIKNYLQSPSLMDDSNTIQGIKVLDCIKEYLEKLKDGSIPYEKMDWRAIRIIWEQKKCVLLALQEFELSFPMKEKLSVKYENVVNDSNIIRLLYAKYHIREDKNILDMMKKKIDKIINQELSILPMFLEELRRKNVVE